MSQTYTRKLKLADSILNIFRMKGKTTSISNSRLLYEGHIAGYQYHEGQKLEHLLTPGADLSLKHEPQNPFDENAVAVYYRGAKLGFVPQNNNLEIAEMLKRGYRLHAKVANYQPATELWERVQMQVTNDFE